MTWSELEFRVDLIAETIGQMLPRATVVTIAVVAAFMGTVPTEN